MGTRDSDATRRRRPPRALVAGVVAGAAGLLLTGCATSDWPDASAGNFFLPDSSVGATNETERISELWDGSWIAALAVGLFVWGLTIWCVVAYRRRKGDPDLPPQTRYNMPIEILYTVVPVMMIGVLFFYTARDQAAILDDSGTPDVTVDVIGKQWSWDFNYLDESGNPIVYEVGRQAELDGEELVEGQVPTLYLPVDQTVQFNLYSRDVAHSFWVPAFLFKMDLYPGSYPTGPNMFQLTPTKEGVFKGKCAELCGDYHAEMLFDVRVVSEAEYAEHLERLAAAGQTGGLPTTIGGELARDPGGAEPAGDETSGGNNS
ncbi:cytochrome c oxidase subunit II [Paenibacillus sp. TRM 82003]|uniref:aa3-type cytochrome oxidase subunit II n=1 Tax=Kineococcus sp. TRM81007 TaxID=2925831 RepID=UPI001F55EBF1|nr:cytochrome c oxidase subunit II [Kineococcus sp. TRM81007]MCI2239652.1 cytochrome c oxidase subunit II [Kineococcus sp. TRM81007]MCI3926784.1 cytochrome c oxidase subunit II [Paenibacillus sp. TRM 82003]